MKYIHSVLIILLLIVLSCDNPFAPALAGDDVPQSNLFTQQKTPSEVLTNFRLAYTFKDSLIYSDVLDSTFIFSSLDYNYSPPRTLDWGRDTEMRTTARMFRFFNTLDVVWNTVSQPDTIEREPDVIIEHKITYTLTLDGGRTIPPLNGDVIFQFIQRKVFLNGKESRKFFISFWNDQKI